MEERAGKCVCVPQAAEVTAAKLGSTATEASESRV